MPRALTFALAMTSMAACADPTDPAPPNGFWSINDTWSGQIVITPNINAPQWPSDAVTIEGFVVNGDSLELAVSYGGGCRDHAFTLLADAAWMESYPVQIGVRLAHDAQGDMCKALLSRVLRFDLSPLKAAYAASYQTASGIIRLNIRGATASPTYAW
jgi:hypothetical protein